MYDEPAFLKAAASFAPTPPAEPYEATPPKPDKLYSFKQRKDGVWYTEEKDNGEPKNIWLCSPLKILGQTRDVESNSWGLLLEWQDRDGKLHRWAMPQALLMGRDGSIWVSQLVDQGLRVNPKGGAKGHLSVYLATYETDKRILCVNTTGWHGERFVLPDVTIEKQLPTIQKIVGQVGQVGQPNNVNMLQCPTTEKSNFYKSDKSDRVNQQVVLQGHISKNPYGVGGNVKDWQDTVGKWSRGNSRLMFAISASLAAVLLEPTGTENGGFNFVGGSSTGKTTTLIAAATVYGRGTAQNGYIQSWRATDNGLEGISCLHNDTCLCLDELGQAPARVTKDAVYMLANGQGKSRAKQDGSARQAKSWRTLILSTGEKTISEKIAEDGGRIQAGQEVRLVDIPADAGMGLGIFEELHGYDNPRAFADAIKDAAATHYGHLARLYIQKLLDEPEVIVEIKESITSSVSFLCPDEKTDGQVQRVARRFLLAAAAGETAAEWGLIPWEEGEALEAAKTCFNAWLSQRGGIGAQEDRVILEQVTLFIEQHGQSRFQDISNPSENCPNRVGFRSSKPNGTEYYILPESFKSEVCKGISHTRAAKLLADKGILLRGDGKNLARRLPSNTQTGLGRPRCYTLYIEFEKNVVE